MIQEFMYIFSIVIAIICYLVLGYYLVKEKNFNDFVIQLISILVFAASIMGYMNIETRKHIKEKLIEIGKIQYEANPKTGETYTVLKDSSLQEIYEFLNK